MPYPRFDMNLQDLFTDDETAAFRQFVRPSMNVPFTQQLAAQQQQHTSPNFVKQEEPLSATTGMSNMQLNSPVISQPLPRQQQSPTTVPTFPQISNQVPYAPFAQTVQSAYPDLGTFSDLDWLDSFPVGSGAQGTLGSQAGGSAANGDGGLSELDLGFGMGLDGGASNHDWADGSSIDLFDGFFFGSGNGGGGAGL